MERILIVDDDPDIQRLVSYNLTQAGFDVDTAPNGRKALETVRQRPPDRAHPYLQHRDPGNRYLSGA